MKTLFALLLFLQAPQWTVSAPAVPKVTYVGPQLTQTVCSGSVTISGTIKSHSLITQSGACQGILATDPVIASTSGNIFTVAGWLPGGNGIPAINVSPGTNQVNVSLANFSAEPIDEGPVTILYRVTR